MTREPQLRTTDEVASGSFSWFQKISWVYYTSLCLACRCLSLFDKSRQLVIAQRYPLVRWASASRKHPSLIP
jgi:hypothetical protein